MPALPRALPESPNSPHSPLTGAGARTRGWTRAALLAQGIARRGTGPPPGDRAAEGPDVLPSRTGPPTMFPVLCLRLLWLWARVPMGGHRPKRQEVGAASIQDRQEMET